jgi:hypothetical protein
VLDPGLRRQKVGTLLALAASGELKQFSHPPVPVAFR